MEIINNYGTDQKIYVETLENGLKVVLLPFENKKNYYVSYTAKYGSVDLDFIDSDGNKVSSNKGIAHFLEHKLFETESGEDPFEFFSKTGTGCNAGTSYKKTSYFIYGVNSIEENLNYLIDFVNTPYFTDENVEKEKGIIIEEIKMYDDNPEWIITEQIQNSTFKNHPIKYDIAGYVDTVESITKEDLYTCYNTFYQPSNMFLVVSGGFDVDKVMNVIKNNAVLSSRNSKFSITKKKVKEPVEITEKFRIIKHPSIETPKISINIKLSFSNEKDKYEYYLYINALMSILFGSSSDFKEEMISNGYITYLSTGRLIIDDYLILEFYAEGTNYEKFIKGIEECIENKEITEEEFERYKKVLIASIVMASDDVSSSADEIIDDIITWKDIINNKVELIKKMDFKKFKSIRENTDFSNMATVVLTKED